MKADTSWYILSEDIIHGYVKLGLKWILSNPWKDYGGVISNAPYLFVWSIPADKLNGTYCGIRQS